MRLIQGLVAPVLAWAIAATGAAGQVLLDARYLLVSATQDDGSPLLGLTHGDIRVEEGGRACAVLEVRPAEYPVAILVDSSRHALPHQSRLREALDQFVLRLGRRPVLIRTFGDPPVRVLDFTTDASRVSGAVGQIFARPDTDSYLMDALIETAQDIRRREAPVSLIVVLSAGGNDQSRRAPIDVLDPILASRSMVHVIDVRPMGTAGRLDRPRGRRAHIDASGHAALALEDFLRVLTDRTLGDYERLYAGSGYAEALRQLAARLSSEVVVEYAVPAGTPAAEDLRVAVRVPGARVRGMGLTASPWR